MGCISVQYTQSWHTMRNPHLLAPPPKEPPSPILALPVVSCGFPSPAEEFSEPQPSLDSIAIQRPAATYLLRAGGDSMIGAGIYPDDVLVVDRSLTAKHYDIVIAVVDGEMTCKRLLIEGSTVVLHSENPAYPDIRLKSGSELSIWGVCAFNLHCLTRLSRR